MAVDILTLPARLDGSEAGDFMARLVGGVGSDLIQDALRVAPNTDLRYYSGIYV